MFDPTRSIRGESDALASCIGKHPYPTAAIAWSVVDRSKRRGKARGSTLRAYQCRTCSKWHVGNVLK